MVGPEGSHDIRFGIATQDPHTAFSDALSTALLFQRFIHILAKNGVSTLKQLSKIGAFTK